MVSQLYHENEIKTNKLAAWIQAIWGLSLIVISVLSWMNIYNLMTHTGSILLFICGIIDIIVLIISILLKFDKPALRDIIIYSIILTAGVVFFFHPLNYNFIIYGPLIISTLYYDSKLVIRVSVICWLIYTGSIIANVIIEMTGSFMQSLHEQQVISLWEYPLQVFLYRYLPPLGVFIITTTFCYLITKRGKTFVSKQAAMTSEISAMETELKIASDIQQSSLPGTSYESPDGKVKINAIMRPAKIVGGDFYDYFMLGSKIVFLIADVSDKGLSAAMFMMKAKNALHNAIASETSMKDALVSVNNTLCKDNTENLFVTLWVGCMDIQTGEGSYINCGHPYPLLKLADGSVRFIENDPDIVLGIIEDSEFTEHPLKLETNESLLLFTDGFTDAVNPQGESFGENRLKETLKDISVLSSINYCDYLLSSIDQFADGADQFDDSTALSIHYLP